MRERIERGDWEGERDGAVEVRFCLFHFVFCVLCFVFCSFSLFGFAMPFGYEFVGVQLLRCDYIGIAG
jgi:hypothetical protein